MIRPADPKRHHLTATDRRVLVALWPHVADGQDSQAKTPRRTYVLTDRVPALGTATLVIQWSTPPDYPGGPRVDRMYRVPVVGSPAKGGSSVGR